MLDYIKELKVTMFQAYKYRIYPTTEQQTALAKSF
ncbi:MAG: helix-turn-helix domain-containing protein, partial [Planktothrix sp.]